MEETLGPDLITQILSKLERFRDVELERSRDVKLERSRDVKNSKNDKSGKAQ